MNKLREAEILLSQGETIALVSKKMGVSAHTYYRWRKEYGDLRVDQACQLKELEQENSRLKKLVADLSLDNAILKEVSRETSKSIQETQDGVTRISEVYGLGKAGMQGTGTARGYAAT